MQKVAYNTMNSLMIVTARCRLRFTARCDCEVWTVCIL